MKWQRTVTFELEADTLEQALEIWDYDGPECGPSVRSVASSNIELAEEGEA